MKNFHIEVVYYGGQYAGLTKNVTTISEAIDFMLSIRVGLPVARGFVAEIKKNEIRAFELLGKAKI